MTLCKCDRCGKVISGKAHNVELPRVIIGVVKEKNRAGNTLILYEKNSIQKSTTDLCDACFAELVKFTMPIDARHAS